MSKAQLRDPDAAQSLAEAAGRAMYARDRASQALGIALAETRPGYARMTMRVREDMLNGHGTCHGGIIFTLADTAFAFSCNSHDRNAVAQHCTITFLQPARGGELLTAVGEERALAGRNGVYDIRVANEKGETVALFRGNSRVIEGRVTGGPSQGAAERAPADKERA